MRLICYLLFTCLLFACSAETVEKQSDTTKITLDPGKKFPSKEIEQKYYRLDTLFGNLSKANAFNGNVLIAQGGTIIYQKSWGIADKTKKIALNDSSLFQLASVSKTLTATTVLLLADEGKLNLNANVKKYIPDFPYEGITVEHLVSHRSGLSNYLYFCADYLKDPKLELSNKDVLELMKKDKPKPYLKPNTHFNYCNTNYILLALIIEKATGMSYNDVVRKKIFDPIGMKHTFFEDELKNINDSTKTKGYTFSMAEVEKDRFDKVCGDKGIYSTTYDMYLFNEVYYTGKLLKKETFEKAIAPHSKELKTHNYGYGWRMKHFNDPEKMVFHNGWWHGYRTALQRRLSDSTTVIILSNRLNSSVYNVTRVLQVLDGKLPGNTKLKEQEESEE